MIDLSTLRDQRVFIEMMAKLVGISGVKYYRSCCGKESHRYDAFRSNEHPERLCVHCNIKFGVLAVMPVRHERELSPKFRT